MALHQIANVADYIRYLERTPDEVASLFKELLINVTRFFRDPEAFEALEKKVLPALLERKDDDVPIRIWVPGCSTGEEAYSLAMLFSEAMEKHKKNIPLQIFASDIDEDAIESGRRAVYPDSISADVTEKRLNRFFTKGNGVYHLKKNIRERVVFAVQDVAKDPPFSRLDLISCRNMLIYMDQPLQKKIFSIFHYSLTNNGFLFLGTSESVGDLTGSFSPVDTRFKIYKKKGIASPANYPQFPDQVLTSAPGKSPIQAGTGFRMLAEKVFAQYFAPPAVLVNEKFDVLYFYGSVDRYLAVSTGEASLNLLRIAREGLRHILGPALSQALKGTLPVNCKNVLVGGDGSARTVDIVIQPISNPGETQRMMLIVFNEKAEKEVLPDKSSKRTARQTSKDSESASLKQELKATREYLQSTIEELQTTNEEFQSTNEELQSTNEELETSKEELQSTNEELVTVNAELQHKVDQLTETSNDVNNLLAGTDIASVFLDTRMHIKRFTPAMVKIFSLMQTDVGRSIRDITSNIVSFDIYEAADHVLATLERKEAEVQNKNGQWFELRIIPYRTMDNIIDGVVITFTDITGLKAIAQQLERTNLVAQGIVDAIRDPFVVLDGDLKIESVNKHFYDFFKVRPEETLGRRIYDLGSGQWNIPQLKELMEKVIPENTVITGYQVEHDFPEIGKKKVALDASLIPQTKTLLLTFREISALSG